LQLTKNILQKFFRFQAIKINGTKKFSAVKINGSKVKL